MTAQGLSIALRVELDRVIYKVVPTFKEIGKPGDYALQFTIEPAIRRGEAALKRRNNADMMMALEELKAIEPAVVRKPDPPLPSDPPREKKKRKA